MAEADASERKPQQRSLETRERLLAAAVDLFADRGFDGATTREIARRAGVALAALPYHFKTKDALWRAAADRLFAQYRERMIGRLKELGDEDEITRTKQLLRELVLFYAGNPHAYRFLLHEGTRRSDRMEWLVDRHLRSIFDYVMESVSRAQRNGYGRKGRPEQLYYMMMGAAATLYSLAPEYERLTGRSAFDPASVEDHVESVLDVFYGTGAAPDLAAADDED